MPPVAFCTVGMRQAYFFWKEVSDNVVLCRVYSLLLELSFSPVHYKKIQPSEVFRWEERNKNYTVCRRHPSTGARSQFRFAITEVLKRINNISGLEVNKHKTEAMWLGSWRNCNEKPFGFK